MKTSEAIKHAVEFIRNADHYTDQDVEVARALNHFVTQWEKTIDVLSEVRPEDIFASLLGGRFK